MFELFLVGELGLTLGGAVVRTGRVFTLGVLVALLFPEGLVFLVLGVLVRTFLGVPSVLTFSFVLTFLTGRVEASVALKLLVERTDDELAFLVGFTLEEIAVPLRGVVILWGLPWSAKEFPDRSPG